MLRAVTLALVSQVVLGQSVTNVYSIDIGEPLYSEGISFSRTSDRVTLTSCVTGMFVQLSASMDMSLIQLYKYETNHTWGLGVHGEPDDSSIFWTVENVAVTGLEGTRVAAYQLHEASDTASAYAEYLVGHALDVDSQRLLFNDFTFDPSGNLFITDSFKSSVEKLAGAAPSAGTAGDLSTLTSGDELGSTEGTVNSNGIVYVGHTDGDFLLVAVNDLGKLVKVNVATGAQSEVSVTGGSLAGGDGMVLLPDGRLVVVASGYVQLVKPTASDWNNATVQYAVDVSSYEGEWATTAALADTDVSVFVTFVRFGDILEDVSGATINASTLVRVEFPEDVEESTTESTTESNTDDTDSSLSVRTSVIFTFAAALKTVGM